MNDRDEFVHISVDQNCDERWESEENILRDHVEPLFDAPAFRRLETITFLGILSPRFAARTKSPIFDRESVKKAQFYFDGSRRSHCIGVASVAFRICRQLALNETQQRYAIAWGLLHDLGNWPLSHTAQYAFTQLVGVDTKSVREWLITDDSRSPQKYRTAEYLERAKIDPERMLKLFKKDPDAELKVVSSIFKSQLTPDMLEGVWRSGRAFGIPSPDPFQFNRAFSSDLLNDIRIVSTHRGLAIEFWKTKKKIYRRFFGSKAVILWESAWSAAVLDVFSREDLSLERSLELDENEIVQRVCDRGVPKIDCQHRWKPPVQQRIKKPIPRELVLSSLDKCFIEEPLEVEDEH